MPPAPSQIHDLFINYYCYVYVHTHHVQPTSLFSVAPMYMSLG